MAKEIKTNVMRVLDKAKIEYNHYDYSKSGSTVGTEIAEILIEHNIEMNISELRLNPLVSAIRYHNNFIAQKLINKKPELIVTYSNEFVQGFTMVDVAKRINNEEIIRVLNAYG